MLKLTVVSAKEIIFEDSVSSVTCPGAEGELTILPNHAPLITILKKGNLVIKRDDEVIKEIEIEKGFLEVSKKETIILI